jgi:CRISPR type III-A-associated RAMP protein Csm4
VDRVTATSGEAYTSGCLEFNQGVGLWLGILFADQTARERWDGPVRAAFRLLADSGFGGERSRGWGRAENPEFQQGNWPGIILDHQPAETEGNSAYWLLGSYVPAASDSVDWKSGYYELKRRNGKVESIAGWGSDKKSLNMVSEGGVVVAASAPTGAAVDVAPEGFAHPVWRAGFAAAVEVPWKAPSFQLPLPPAKAEPVKRREVEPEAVLADIYLTD